MRRAVVGSSMRARTSLRRFANLEDLDWMVGAGMESGAVESWERLAELVEQGGTRGRMDIVIA